MAIGRAICKGHLIQILLYDQIKGVHTEYSKGRYLQG